MGGFINIILGYYIYRLIFGIAGFFVASYFIKKYFKINVLNILYKGFINIKKLIKR